MTGKNNNLLLLAVLIICLFAFSACSETVEESIVKAPIMENSVTSYVIVRGDTASDGDIKAAIALCNAVKDKTGIELKLTTDFEKPNSEFIRSDFEILVGSTNRDEDMKPLCDDYGWNMPSTRVCIFGGSDENLMLAVEDFVANCVSDTGIFVPPNGKVHYGDYPMKDMSVGGIKLTDIMTIYCHNDTLAERANGLSSELGKLSGRVPTVKVGPPQADDCAIVLGCLPNDGRIARLGADEGIFVSDGKQIFIATNSQYNLHSNAVDTFVDEILASGRYSDSLNLTTELSYRTVELKIGEIYPNPREVPNDVYKTPYRESQFTTVYAPWFKQYHIMSDAEYRSGVNGGEACQLIRQMSVSQIDPNVVYFITDTSGIWKTTDGGKQWYNTTNNVHGTYGTGILCDKHDVNTIYAYLYKSGAFRTTDGGLTWAHLLEDTSSYHDFTANRFAQDDSGNTYIAAGSGIYKLERNGDKLINLYAKYAALKDNASANFNDIYVSGDGLDIYAGGGHSTRIEPESYYKPGLYISHDGGKSWEVTSPIDGKDCVVYTIAVDPENENRILVVAKEFDSQNLTAVGVNAIYESLDKGKSFKYLYKQKNSWGEAYRDIILLRYGPKNTDGVHPLYLVGQQMNYNLNVSYDNGKTFKAMLSEGLGNETWRGGTTGFYMQPIAIVESKPDTFYYALGGVWKYENGKFEHRNSGFSGASATQFNMDNDGNMLIGYTDLGTAISNSPYTSECYATFSRGDSEIITMYAIDPKDSKHVLAFSGSSNTAADKVLGIVESFDGGKTFSDIIGGTEVSQNTVVFEYSQTNPDTIFSSTHISRDNGKTWEKTEYFICAVSKQNNLKMVAMKDNLTTGTLVVSEDGGKSWRDVVKPGIRFVQAEFDLQDDNKLWFSHLYFFGYIDLEKGVRVDLNKKFAYARFNCFAQNPNNPKHLIVSGRPGFGDDRQNPNLYESTDGGESFHSIPGSFSAMIGTVYFSKTTEEVFIGGLGGTFIYDYEIFWNYLDRKGELS